MTSQPTCPHETQLEKLILEFSAATDLHEDYIRATLEKLTLALAVATGQPEEYIRTAYGLPAANQQATYRAAANRAAHVARNTHTSRTFDITT